MTALGGFKSYNLEDVAFLLTGEGKKGGDDVVMASGQTSSLTPNHRHPPGTVLGKKTGDGKFYLATDSANVDSPAPASINTAVTNPGSGGWDGNVVISGHWGTITVALSSDDTDADVAAAINAAVAAQNPETQARITAADASGSVSITNLDTGEGTWLHAAHATVTTMFGSGGADAVGTDPDYRVTTYWAELKDLEGTAVDAMVPTLLAGHFDGSELSALTAEAKAVLQKRGSRFD